MITVQVPPPPVGWVLQVLSLADDTWCDVAVADARTTALGDVLVSLPRWRTRHPGRKFRLIRRTLVEEVLHGPTD